MNRQRGYIPFQYKVVEVDDAGNEVEKVKVLYFRYTFNSLAILEQELGIKITQLKPHKLGAAEMITFIWAGLIHENKDLTKEEVGEMMAGNAKEMMEKASEALAYCMGGEQAVNEAKKKLKARHVGPGSKSSKSGSEGTA